MFGRFKRKEKALLPVVRDETVTRRVFEKIESKERNTVTQEAVPDSELPAEKPVCVYHLSHIGTREYQQDACFVSHGEYPYTFAILCDGMGGMTAGEEASHFVAEKLGENLYGLDVPEEIPILLEMAVYEINREILQKWEQGRTGTTLAAAVLWGNQLYWISAGDSRIYIWRKNELVQITRDHNYALQLAQLVKQQKISEQEASEDPQREALISYMGIPRLEVFDKNQTAFILEDGDILLLCSDGLTKVLSDDEICEILKLPGDAKAKAECLICQAMLPDGLPRDNTTVVVITCPFSQEAGEENREGEKAYETGEM